MQTREKRIKKNISDRVLKEKENLRNLILESSAKLLLEKGYEKFSLRQVAESIGYSATTIYLYFKDKDELLFSVILEGFKIFYEMLVEASQKKQKLEDKLKNVGIAYIKFAINNPSYYQVMFMQRSDLILKEGVDIENTPMVKSLKLLEELVEKCIKEGVLKTHNEKDSNYFVRIIWSVVHGVASLYIAMPSVYSEKEIMEMSKISVNMILKGLG